MVDGFQPIGAILLLEGTPSLAKMFSLIFVEFEAILALEYVSGGD
jgi:hypothetical protein